jgi:hypothetical protein
MLILTVSIRVVVAELQQDVHRALTQQQSCPPHQHGPHHLQHMPANNRLQIITPNNTILASYFCSKGFKLCVHLSIRYPHVIETIGRGFCLVVRAADWHTDDPGSIPGRDGLYTFGCIPQRFESASAEILRYIKTLICL